MLPPIYISHPVVLKNALFSGQRCGNSQAGLGLNLASDGIDAHTVVRIDKIVLHGSTVGYVYIMADYHWFVQADFTIRDDQTLLRRIYGKAMEKSPDWKVFERDLPSFSVPVNYRPFGMERERCVAADLRGHI